MSLHWASSICAGSYLLAATDAVLAGHRYGSSDGGDHRRS
jgi:putative intracellular protease/amidase